MQSAACAIAVSTPLLQPRRLPSPNPSLRLHLRPVRPAATFSAAAIRALPLPVRRISLADRICDPAPAAAARGEGVVVRAAAADGGAVGDGEASEKSGAFLQTLQLGALFGLWYLFNIYFNIYNKQVLKVFPYPITITTLQFAVGTAFTLLMWLTNIYRRPKISSAQLFAILPLAVVHTMGNLFTNMSLGKVAVSFTHTIKAMEPFFLCCLVRLVPWRVAYYLGCIFSCSNCWWCCIGIHH